MKNFANLPAATIAQMLGVELTGRKIKLQKSECISGHFLTAQIQLYLSLCFYANTNDGSCGYIPIMELAHLIGRDPKTVKRSLSLLEDSGLLLVEEWAEEDVFVRLLNLKDMYLRRGEGGKGYITCSIEMLDEILTARDIATLRALLIALLIDHAKSISSASKQLLSNRITLDDFKLAFPVSARPRDIRKAVSESGAFGRLFTRTSPDTKKVIQVKLKENLNGKVLKSQIRLEAKSQIGEFVSGLNAAIQEANKSIQKYGKMYLSHTDKFYQNGIDILGMIDINEPGHALPALDLSSDERNDCAVLAQDYGVGLVLDAIRIFYREYAFPGNFKRDRSRSIGGLIRSILSELLQIPQAAIF